MNRNDPIRKTWHHRVFLAVAASLLMTGCGGGAGGATPPPPIAGLPGAPTSVGTTLPTTLSGPGAPVTTGTTSTATTTGTSNSAQPDNSITLGGADSSAGNTGKTSALPGKVQVYFVSSKSCAPCQQMKAGAWPEAQRQYPNVSFTLLDADTQFADAARVGFTRASSVPSFFFFKDGLAQTGYAFTGAYRDKLFGALDSLTGSQSASSGGYTAGTLGS